MEITSLRSKNQSSEEGFPILVDLNPKLMLLTFPHLIKFSASLQRPISQGLHSTTENSVAREGMFLLLCF